jgi:GNAT superfamily N-acetyltransferase
VSEVEELVASMLNVPRSLLRTPGVHAVPALPGYHGVYVWQHGDTTIVAADRTLGPSQHAYLALGGSSFEPDPDVRVVTGPADVAALRDAVGADDWHEGGFGDEPGDDRWWVLGDGLAAGNMTDVAGSPTDVGLVTHPDHRGRGLATRVAGTMLAWARDEGYGLARYRALATNLASLRVAEKLGFTPFGANVAVRLGER